MANVPTSIADTPITAGKVTSADFAVDGQGLLTLAASNAAIDGVLDDFWPEPDFEITKWNKLYPYQLIVVDVKADSGGNVLYSQHKNAVYTLPFSPESLRRTKPFASNLTITLGGVVEENNGSPIEYLSFTGTTGHLPKRASSPDNQSLQSLSDLTGGVVQGTINQLAGSLTDVVSFTKSMFSNANNVHVESDFTPDSDLSKTTGYYQIYQLRRFLEAYSAIKKTTKGRNIRLAVALWKDSEILLVTPTVFTSNKDISTPLEYKYSLEFKAWKRITLLVSDSAFQAPTPVRNNPSALARVINTLSNARKIIQDIGNIPQAVLGDITHVNEVFRQSIGFCKDVAGTIQNFADLPSNVKESIVTKVFQDGRDFKQAGNQVANSSSNLKKNWLDQSNPSTPTRNSKVGIPKNPVMKGLLNKTFDDASMDTFIPYMNSSDRANIAKDSDRLRSLTRADFERMRDDLSVFAARLAFLLGAGSDTYKATYGLGDIKPIKDQPTDSDWEMLFALNDSLVSLDSLAATGSGEPSEPARLMDSMATLARASGIAFQVPTSKFAVPFPYGATLESLAAQYLGDPNRALEIIALNGLREPYVDELGVDLPLLVNGSGNTAIVAFTNNLFVGQTVSVGSNGAIRGNRKIIGLVKTLDNKLVLALDGNNDLDRYRVNDNAVVHAYLPDTVNSQNLIFIPSDKDPIENDYLTKDIPTVDTTDPMVVAGGVDLLLDSKKDLILTSEGDSPYAKGLTNIIQGVEIAFAVPQGKLLLHRGFGLPVRVGQSMADTDAKSIVKAVKNMLSSDGTFSSVGRVTVTNRGNVSSIDASAVVAGTRAPLPLSFGVK